MKTRVISFFYFSRKERLGVVALLVICSTLFSLPTLLEWWRPKRSADFSEFEAVVRAFRKSNAATVPEGAGFAFDPNLASEEDLLRLGLNEKVVRNICNYRQKGGAFRQAEDFKKIWSLAAEDYERLLPFIRIGGEKSSGEKRAALAPFDPNTAGETELQQLGLPARAVQSILHFREKGGRFRSKDDLSRIYTLSDDDFERIEPYVRIGAAGGDSLRPHAYAGLGTRKIKGPIDLNSADQEALMGLPLVGEKRAAQILRFREKLGGFISVDQLAEMYNLPDSVFQLIRPKLFVGGDGWRKINLNTASVEALDAHPYVSKKQAELITAYRSQHGPFARPEDVLQIKAFTDPAWWEKVAPYLSVE